ncbi:MAG: structural protein P5 [Betaproteobacteria bacterium]|nr:structural protein P5 [Betaproteobacteria bacterium]
MILTRGERNCNPGNIERRDGTVWQGQADDQAADSRFVVFENPVFGIRALAKVLLAYYHKHGLDTVRGIIDRWAPPSENNTGAYVNHVATVLGVGIDAKIDVTDPETLEVLVRAIIEHENGRCVYADNVVAKGVESALT